MLRFHSPTATGAVPVDIDGQTIPADVTWIDALKPDTKEIEFLERCLGIEVPTLESLSEIETSSRLSKKKDRLFLSTPACYRTASGLPRTSPLGLALSKTLLLTVRFRPLEPLDQLHQSLATQASLPAGGHGALVTVLDAIVEHLADEIERIGADLDHLSEAIFGSDGPARHEHHRREKSGEHLRFLLRKVGRAGEHAGKISEVLLGMDRLLTFVIANSAGFVPDEGRAELKSLKRSLDSLDDYQTHVTEKIHFLLDATLGLTNIDQNEIFRVLTAVSVVGIPPTFIASLYGMNFKSIPELDWSFGYAYALGLITLSAILPIVWFKRQGWW